MHMFRINRILGIKSVILIIEIEEAFEIAYKGLFWQQYGCIIAVDDNCHEDYMMKKGS